MLAGLTYFGIYRLHRWVMEMLGDRLIDVTEETTAMWATLGVYAGTALLLVTLRACFDYAKIAIVVGERSSAFFSALHGIAFVARRPLQTIGMVLLFALLTAIPLALYVVFRPSVETTGAPGVIHAVLLGQGWLLARLTLRLTLVAAQTALYRQS